MKDKNLQPGREDWVRHPDCISELVRMVKEVWIEDCQGVATDWPWNDHHVQLTFIQARKANVKIQEEARAMMENGSLFKVEGGGKIYFLLNSRGHVKIGWTGKEDAVERIPELQTGESEPLRLHSWMPGTKRQEDAMHVRFAASRIRPNGEWFYWTAELQEVMDRGEKC